MAGEEKSAWGRTKLTESHFLEDGEERVEEEEVWIEEKEPAVSGRCGHKKRKLTRNLLAPNEAPKKDRSVTKRTPVRSLGIYYKKSQPNYKTLYFRITGFNTHFLPTYWPARLGHQHHIGPAPRL